MIINLLAIYILNDKAESLFRYEKCIVRIIKIYRLK